MDGYKCFINSIATFATGLVAELEQKL